MWNLIIVMPRRIVLFLIRVWQMTLSVDHGFGRYLFEPFGRCKYQPTCSQYAYDAISRYGVMRGGLMATNRLFRCNPFSKGGYDPVENSQYPISNSQQKSK